MQVSSERWHFDHKPKGFKMRKGRCVKWSKGRTRCMRRAKPASGSTRRGGRSRRKKCPYGVAKGGPRKGMCLKHPRKK